MNADPTRGDSAFAVITNLLTRVDGNLNGIQKSQTDLEVRFARLEESNKSMITQLEKADRTKERLTDLEKQVDQYVWLVRGVIAVFSAFVVAAGLYTQLK